MTNPHMTLPLAPVDLPLGAPAAPPIAVGSPQPEPVPEPRPVLPVGPPSPAEVGVFEVAENAGVIDDVLAALIQHGGSDLHLNAGLPPMMRVDGDLRPVPGWQILSGRQVHDLVYATLTERQRAVFEENLELDLAIELPGTARFRVNVLRERGQLAAVFRVIPWKVATLESLGIPEAVAGFANLTRGLVLVTGPTGSGKSTTLAAIVDRINRTRPVHIVTIEDPVEFIHESRTGVVSQREVGEDTHSFAHALRHALRQDPDVILVGEMRDLETISIALTAAETGHLVLGTLHTSSAGSTIDRIIDAFPPEQQAQIRTQLAGSLSGVVCQSLCKVSDGDGRVAATEVMVTTPAIRNLIREGKIASIPSALQTGSKLGMHTLNQDLARLVEEGRISHDVALAVCSDIGELNQLLGFVPAVDED